MRPTHLLTLVTVLVCAGGAYAQEPFEQTFRAELTEEFERTRGRWSPAYPRITRSCRFSTVLQAAWMAPSIHAGRALALAAPM